MRKLNRHSTVAAFSLTAALVLGACAPAATDMGGKGTGGSGSGSGGSGSGSGGSGSGGSGSGSGGSGSGGSASGTGGTPSGTGGSASGTGGSASGTGGSASGTGGMAAGTGGTSGTPDAGGTPDTAAAGPTFTKIYTEVLMVSCAGAACHTGGAPKDGVDFNDKMKAFTSATTKKTMVIARIKSTNAAMRMPKGKDALPAATIKMIEDWYAAGGKND